MLCSAKSKEQCIGKSIFWKTPVFVNWFMNREYDLLDQNLRIQEEYGLITTGFSSFFVIQGSRVSSVLFPSRTWGPFRRYFTTHRVSLEQYG